MPSKILVRNVLYNKRTGQPSVTLPKKKLKDFFGKPRKTIKFEVSW